MRTISTFPFLNSRQPKLEQNSLMIWLLKILLWRPAFNFWRRAKPVIWHYLSDKKWTKGHLQRKLRSWKISSKLPKSENNDLLRLSKKRRQISEKYLIDLLVISFDFPYWIIVYLPAYFNLILRPVCIGHPKMDPFWHLSKGGLISESFSILQKMCQITSLNLKFCNCGSNLATQFTKALIIHCFYKCALSEFTRCKKVSI